MRPVLSSPLHDTLWRYPEVMIENMVKLCEYALERADEARQLMVHLKRP
jgi:hypothetical protein